MLEGLKRKLHVKWFPLMPVYVGETLQLAINFTQSLPFWGFYSYLLVLGCQISACCTLYALTLFFKAQMLKGEKLLLWFPSSDQPGNW